MAEPFPLPAIVNVRLAFALEQSAVAITRSNIASLVIFGAFAYSTARFFMSSRRAAIDNV